MPTQIVPDEVWVRLDPTAGRLTSRERTAVIGTCGGLVLLLVLVLAGFVAGVINPNLYGEFNSSNDDTRTHVVELGIRIENGSRLDQRISAVAISVPGARLTEPVASGFTIPAHGHRAVQVRLVVDDCSRVRQGDAVRIRVVTNHLWGHQTQTLEWDGGGNSLGPSGDTWRACH